MKRHSCSTCGFIHRSPKTSSTFISLLATIFLGVVVTLGALATDGVLSVLLWVTVAIYVFALLAVLGGLSMAASNALRDEVRS